MMETIPLDDVIRRYNEGQSPYQIAKHYETYPNRIRRMLEKANIAMRGKSEAQKLALKSGVSNHPTEGRNTELHAPAHVLKHLRPVDDQRIIVLFLP